MAVAAQTLVQALDGADGAHALLLAGRAAPVTRRQLRDAVLGVARALRAAGVRCGDVVSLAEANTVEFVVAFLGVTAARAVAAPLNPNYTQAEFAFFIEDAASKLLLVPAGGSKLAEAAAGKLRVPTARLRLSDGPGGPQLALDGLRASGQPPGGSSLEPAQPADVALFLHTSGTTSRPKGVPLSQGNLAASLANIAATYELSQADRSLLVMPLFHVHGLMAGLLAPLAAGAAVIIPQGGKFSATSFWQDAVKHGATFFTAVPTIHQVLLARAGKDYPRRAPPPLRFIRSCSSSLAAATLEKLEAAFGVPVLEAYAMTEAAHQMTSNPLPKHGPHKAGTVGRAQGSVRVAVLDAQNRALPPGVVGEVCIRGPNVTRGYLNNPKANEEGFAGGWFHTGDQGFLDEEGFLTLTGRIKELINRGGEKISPIEVDGVLLSHPQVAEAVAFAAPDEKFGEIVAAAVVPASPVADTAAFARELRQHAAARLAKFKVPERVFVTDRLPKTATGKIQRRMMVEAFMGKAAQGERQAAAGKQQQQQQQQGATGFAVVARSLAAAGVRHIYGVVGIPVTELASAAQAVGIRYIGFRNEQAAGYAAAACGFLTGAPGVLLTVSGPGAVHGLAGLAHAQANTWPMLMLSGSAEQGELGKGSFQELDQVAAARRFTKYAGQAARVADVPRVVQAAVQATVTGRPGAAYVDIPSDVLFAAAEPSEVPPLAPIQPASSQPPLFARPPADAGGVAQAARLLQQAQRPLAVVGKGAAFSRADAALRALVGASGLPFLATAMGRGVVPDSHAACANAARSTALAGADVAIVFGARLNWQLHFGEPPKWAAGVRFILVDPEPSARDAQRAVLVLRGDAATVAGQLTGAVGQLSVRPWREQLAAKAASAKRKLAVRLRPTTEPLDYLTSLRVLRDAMARLSPAPIIVSEGANTMDNARLILEPAEEGRLRLDAGTWGTMGVGLGFAIAAATAQPQRLVVAVEGDSAFGFSGMELETVVRYQLPIVVVVMNNDGIYGGDRREAPLRAAAAAGAEAGGFGGDPAPTAFVPGTRYERLAEAFHGRGYHAATAAGLQSALQAAFAQRRPALVNVVLDPMAGVESGNVHAFNAPKASL